MNNSWGAWALVVGASYGVVAILLSMVLEILAVRRAFFAAPGDQPPGSPQLIARLTRRQPKAASDPAWPSYVSVQSWSDLKNLHRIRGRLYRSVWATFNRVLRIAVVLLLPLIIGTLFMLMVFWILETVLLATVRIVAGTVALVLVAFSLLLDQLWAWQFRVSPTCLQCFEIMQRPAFGCSGCGEQHHDIRSGTLGVMYRKCRCGTVLPASVLRAAQRLVGACQACGAELPPGAGRLGDVRISMVGDSGSGKSQLVAAAIATLRSRTSSSRSAAVTLFGHEAPVLEHVVEVVVAGGETRPTTTNPAERITMRVGSGIRSKLVHVFDPPGNSFHSAEAQAGMTFLDTSDALIFVVDPEALPGVRELLPGGTEQPGGHWDPDDTYGEVVARLRDSGLRGKQQTMAVVVTKADLLLARGVQIPKESTALGVWLHDHGAHNLVLAAQNDFAALAFFAVSSAPAAPAAAAYDPTAPFQWIHRQHGGMARTAPVAAMAATRSRQPTGAK